MDQWLEKITDKIGVADLVHRLTDRLSGTELNTLLLDLFRKKSTLKSINELKNSFQQSRFFKPSSIDPILYKTLEIQCLSVVQSYLYTCIELSPLTSFGTSSILAPIDQNMVVSAISDSEVVSDATNVLALIIADKLTANPDIMFRYACTHRHTRAQAFTNPAFTAHFGVLCLATGGIDQGDFTFEINQIQEHIDIHIKLIKSFFPECPIYLKIMIRKCQPHYSAQLKSIIHTAWEGLNIEWIDPAMDHSYYPHVQFKLFLCLNDQWIDLADGGLVDWTQKLTQNRKQRMMISGLGLELVYKLKAQMNHVS